MISKSFFDSNGEIIINKMKHRNSDKHEKGQHQLRVLNAAFDNSYDIDEVFEEEDRKQEEEKKKQEEREQKEKDKVQLCIPYVETVDQRYSRYAKYFDDNPANEQRLFELYKDFTIEEGFDLYGLGWQAHAGDNNAPEPPAINFIEHGKWKSRE